MKLEWMLIAEGFGTASNGAITAIGVNQQLIIAPALPITSKRGVLAHFVDDVGTLAGQEVEVTLTIYDPSGKPMVAQTLPTRTNDEPPWPGLRAALDVLLEVPLRLSAYGEYQVTLAVKQSGSEPVEGSVSLYVKEPLETLPMQATSRER
jgi:hypothetical protein